MMLSRYRTLNCTSVILISPQKLKVEIAHFKYYLNYFLYVPGIMIQFPAMVRDPSHIQNVQIGSLDHPPSYQWEP